jgi:pentafunctional AROM polypeptide
VSSAVFPTVLAVMHKRRIELTGIGAESIQGEAEFFDLLEKLGCSVNMYDDKITVMNSKNILQNLNEVNMNNCTDSFMGFGILLATMTKGWTKITGISNQRVKECNRIKALVEGLNASGFLAYETSDGLCIKGQNGSLTKRKKNILIKTYNDHRVAMAFAVLGSLQDGIVIENKNCVNKTFPEFWNLMESKFQLKTSASKNLDQKDKGDVIYLIGMRNAGKTILGTSLAK